MKNDYSFENFKKRREEIRKKTLNTKNSLLRLFLTTFLVVLLSFLVLAGLFSPHLNIPALNDDPDSVTNMSSSDFKSRIDFRLKQIQMDDETINSPLSENQKQKSEAETKIPNMITQKQQEGVIKLDLSNSNSPQSTNNMSVRQNQPAQMQPPIKKNDIQQPPAPYVPKTVQDNSKNYKILVGNYASPEDAQELSDIIFANSSSAGKPYVKSYNGIYCVQVGSYLDFTKAQNIANAYRSKNYKVRVVEE